MDPDFEKFVFTPVDSDGIAPDVTKLSLGPKQTELLCAPDRVIDADGPWGCGKSLGCFEKMFLHAKHYAKVARCLVGRASYPGLRVLMTDFYELCPRAWVSKRKDGAPPECDWKNGAHFDFRPLDERFFDENVGGANYTFIFVDQAEQVTRTVFHKLQGRLRKKGALQQMVLDNNPEGHDWVYKEFIDPDTRVKSHRYIKFDLDENRHNLPPGVIESWMKLPPHVRAQYVEGSREAFAGLVYPQFNQHIHVIQDCDLPKHLPRFRAIDPGYGGVTCCLWGVLEPKSGAVIIYNELYEHGMTAREAAEAILSFEPDANYLPTGTVLDYQAWASTREDRERNTLSRLADDYAEHGLYCEKAVKQRDLGVNKVADYLGLEAGLENRVTDAMFKIDEGVFGSPRLFIMERCQNLLSEIVEYRWKRFRADEGGRVYGKVDTLPSPDHAMDAMRYLIVAVANWWRPQEQEAEEPDDGYDEAGFSLYRSDSGYQAVGAESWLGV